jgi:hypothetical protein
MYRISVYTQDGQDRGYQIRDLDRDLFAQIVLGQSPVGDSEAQTRDSSDVDTTFTNQTCVYHSVWSNSEQAWIRSIDPEEIDVWYQNCNLIQAA